MVVMNKCEYTKMELIKMLEAKLGEDEMVVVGGGKDLTDKMKEQLHSLTDCEGGCGCDCEGYTQEEYDDAVAEAYEDGKADGYAEARRESEVEREEAYDEGYAEAMHRVREALADLMD